MSSYNETLQEIASQKGLTVQQLEKFLDELAFIESKGDYSAIQFSPGAVNKAGKVTDQGPGKGGFQIEQQIGDASGRNKTTLQRAINYYDSDATNRKAPEWMLSLQGQDYDASQLTPEQQRELVILDFRMGQSNLADLPKLGTLGMWSKYWKVSGAEPGSPDYIRAEKDLKIFAERQGEEQPTEQVAETPSYTVEPGDTLYSIAQKTGRSVEELRTINNILDPTTLQPGTILMTDFAPEEEEPLVEEPSFFNDLIEDYANPFLQRIFGR